LIQIIYFKMILRIIVFFVSLFNVAWFTVLGFPGFRWIDDYFYGVQKSNGNRVSVAELNKDGWKHGYLSVNGLKLHYVSKIENEQKLKSEFVRKPLMLFVHGFPENWYSWRHQMTSFSQVYHTVAIDMRGYGYSDKPPRRVDYEMDHLTSDVKGVILALDYKDCVLVAHDWGAAVAWRFAQQYPEMVSKLIICNVPHPRCMIDALAYNETQMRRSWYIFFFQIPFLAEKYLSSNNFRGTVSVISKSMQNKDMLSKEDKEYFRESASQTGAITAMVNYYRNVYNIPNLRRKINERMNTSTLLIWGEMDSALGAELTYETHKYVRNLQVAYISEASHWVQQDDPIRVNAAIRNFLNDS